MKLVGGMSPKDKQKSVDRFQTDPDVRLFVGSITAAGVGITLDLRHQRGLCRTGLGARQRLTTGEDRLHRIGQTGNVLVQHLVLESSLDARLAHTLVAKQRVMDKMLDTKTAVAYPTKPVYPATERTLPHPWKKSGQWCLPRNRPQWHTRQ